jgi:hypothetical protein
MFFPCLLLGSLAFQLNGTRGGSAERWSVERLVEYHQQHYRYLGTQDIYKMLYQANFGVEHLLSDSGHVLSYLLGELGSLDTTDRGEPLLERISTDDSVVRVNLRPFKALNLKPDLLVHAMILSARKTMPDTLHLLKEWNDFVALVRYGIVHFPPREVDEWDNRVAVGPLTAVHHSLDYVRANAPAYRVVRREVFERLFPLRGDVRDEGSRWLIDAGPVEKPGEL